MTLARLSVCILGDEGNRKFPRLVIGHHRSLCSAGVWGSSLEGPRVGRGRIERGVAELDGLSMTDHLLVRLEIGNRLFAAAFEIPLVLVPELLHACTLAQDGLTGCIPAPRVDRLAGLIQFVKELEIAVLCEPDDEEFGGGIAGIPVATRPRFSRLVIPGEDPDRVGRAFDESIMVGAGAIAAAVLRHVLIAVGHSCQFTPAISYSMASSPIRFCWFARYVVLRLIWILGGWPDFPATPSYSSRTKVSWSKTGTSSGFL